MNESLLTAPPPNGFDEMLARWHDLTEARRAHEDKAKEFQSAAASLEPLLVEACAANGTQSIKRNGKTFYLAHERSITVPAEHRAAAVEAARALGLDDMIVLQPQRFGAYAREMLNDDGGKLPAEFEPLVKIFEQTRLRMRSS